MKIILKHSNIGSRVWIAVFGAVLIGILSIGSAAQKRFRTLDEAGIPVILTGKTVYKDTASQGLNAAQQTFFSLSLRS